MTGEGLSVVEGFSYVGRDAERDEGGGVVVHSSRAKLFSGLSAGSVRVRMECSTKMPLYASCDGTPGSRVSP